jgi:hypothetical protein
MTRRSPLTLVQQPPRKITMKSLKARRGSFILKQIPHWNEMIQWSTFEPVTDAEKKLAAQMLEALDGMSAYWREKLLQAKCEKMLGKLKVHDGGKKP